MKRPVEHYEYLRRSFDSTCDEIEARRVELVDAATVEATRFAADLVAYLEQGLGFFDQDERVHAVAGALQRTPKQASMLLQWQADPTKRVLPNVEAELFLTPIISSGSSATCELRLTGTYEPPPRRHRSMVENVLVRKVADATLHTFLRHLARSLEHDEP